MLKELAKAILLAAALIAMEVLTPNSPEDLTGQKTEFSQAMQHRQEMHRLGLEDNF